MLTLTLPKNFHVEEQRHKSLQNCALAPALKLKVTEAGRCAPI